MPSSIEPLSLPPPGFYLSFDALFEAAQAHAASAGYAFTISRSTKKKGRIIKVLSCKKGGREFKASVEDDNRIRQRNTFKSACQFRINAKERPTDQWELCHCESS